MLIYNNSPDTLCLWEAGESLIKSCKGLKETKQGLKFIIHVLHIWNCFIITAYVPICAPFPINSFPYSSKCTQQYDLVFQYNCPMYRVWFSFEQRMILFVGNSEFKSVKVRLCKFILQSLSIKKESR